MAGDETNWTEYTKQAQALVAEMVKGDFKAATSHFDKVMTEAMPADKLGEAWGTVVNQVGGFKQVAGTRTEKVEIYPIIPVTCRFEDAAIDIKVVFDPRTNQVTGLSFVPAPTEAR